MGTTHYCGIIIDEATDNYTVPLSTLMRATIKRQTNGPSAYDFSIHNPDGASNALFAMSDSVHMHVGVEPLMMWGSVSALTLDGSDDDVVVTKHASINFGTGDFTVAFRFKIPAMATSMCIMEKGDVGDGEFWIISMNSSGALICLLYDGGSHASVTSATGLDDNRWHDAILTLDRDGNGQWYIDSSTSGAAVDISSVTDVDDNAEDLYIGARNAGNWYLAGKLDELMIWSEVISAGDRANYSVGTPDTTNLQLYLDFDDGYGSVATDESTNTNNGAIRSGGAAALDRWVNPKILAGTIQEIEISRDVYKSNVMTCRGEDDLSVLAYRLARATFPGAMDVSTIFTNLLDEFASGEYTTVNVDAAGYNVTDFSVATRKAILSVMGELVELPSGANFDFWLDGGNDIHWHERGSSSYNSGVTLSGSNIKSFTSTRSAKDKKTFIHIYGASKPNEQTSATHNTVTDSVSLHGFSHADDFYAEHDYLMKISLYVQKVGTPGADLTGRVCFTKNDAPSGDFKVFTLREEDISTDGGWYSVLVDVPTQVGQRYFIKLDKVGADASNTYKWYGDTPAVLDTLNAAMIANDVEDLAWSKIDYDLSMKIWYGIFVEITAEDDSTPKQEAVVWVRRGVDDATAQAIADSLLDQYLETSFFASLLVDAPSVELKPADLITLDESDSGLASKTYRIESVGWDFEGALCRADRVALDIASLLPYVSLEKEVSDMANTFVSNAGSVLESGDVEGAEPDRVGRSVSSRSLVGFDPEA